MLDISILILSWKHHDTLLNTLESYKKNNLLSIAKEKIIFFQETSDKDIEIAKHYDCKYISTDKNIGIGSGLYELACTASSPYILFLENDWELICDESTTYNRLAAGITLLNQYNIDVIRYRHRVKYGHPNYALQFAGKELSAPFCLLESSYWLENPEIKFPDYIKKIQIESEYFYITSSKNANFTNNPTLYNREFYLNIVKPYITPGFEPESSIQKWWEKQNYKVAQGEGLFFHNRLEPK
jgi:hypothetical protein